MSQHSTDPAAPTTMSRARFLKTLGAGAAALASGWSPTQLLAAPPPSADVSVYPTGVYPTDVEEVSAAVNGKTGPSGITYPGGGIVRLKSHNAAGAPMFFNFGGAYPSLGRGTVQVRRDVTIIGETMAPVEMAFPHDPAPEPGYIPDRTVVYGGKRAFACPAFAPTFSTLTVKNVYFAYPSLAAVQVGQTAGLEVSNCVIYDVKPDDTGAGFSTAEGVEATGFVGGPTLLFGDFRVMNNRIRRATPVTFPPSFPFVDSGIVMNVALMTGQIMANDIERFSATGVAVDRNNGPVTVAGNTCRACGYGPNPMSAGIVARGTTTPLVVERNRVIGGFAGPGVSLPSKNGISLASSHVVARSNTIDGAFAAQGLLLTSFSFAGNTWFATDNRVEKNDLVESTSSGAQVLLSAGCDRNRFASNDYGSVGGAAEAGMVVQSAGNAFVNEAFWGSYSGTAGQPCILLTSSSSGNRVSAFKYQGPPQGFDVCNQVIDLGSNDVHGSSRCT